MLSTRYRLVLLLPMQLATGFLVSAPRGTAHPDTAADCSGWVSSAAGTTCASIEASQSITAEQFATWNPASTLSDGSCAIVSGYDYCVQVNYGNATTTPTNVTTPPTTNVAGVASSSLSSTASALAPDTSNSNSAAVISNDNSGSSNNDNNNKNTPSPIEPGVITGCNAYHSVAAGDSCQSIVAEAHIDMADFIKWNPNVGPGCATLWLGYYVCTGVITQTPNSASPVPTTLSAIPTPVVAASEAVATPSTPSTPSSSEIPESTNAPATSALPPAPASSAAVVPPNPVQKGIASQCDHYEMVKAGDTCYSISTAEGVSLSDFYTWNPSVGTDCSNLWQGYYVCIGEGKTVPVVDSVAVPASASTSTSTSSTMRVVARTARPTSFQRRRV
ncbi:LysM domain-containing protein [Penicillium ucsense]|uniref:LysM domain-containing protein n=1 Tax=Penicillium ucsense TaxID=2839758 RepID=A0A8J8W912_9EURO|nr:LysM domain-containing protein [Penicillium ucsense]KAF7735503.1 LysM domain-containing protein [Penicillium ucsense]